MEKPKDKKHRRNLNLSKNSKVRSKSQEGSQSIQRAIAILRVVAMYNQQGIRLSKLARELGFPITTAHRMLSALYKERFVSYSPNSKLYNLGIDLYSLGKSAKNFAIIDQYRSVLENIAYETEDTAYLAIQSGNDAYCIERIEGKYPIRVLALEPGNLRPLGIGGSSLALLAFLANDQVESIIAKNEQRYNNFNRTSDDIRKLVAKARKLGYAVTDGAMHPETRAVGVPILNHKREIVCAISVGALRHRLDPARCRKIAQFIKSKIKNLDLIEIETLH